MTRYKTFDLASGAVSEASLEEIGAAFDAHGVVVLPEFLAELQPLNGLLDLHFAPLLEDAIASMNAAQSPEKRAFECDVLSWDPYREGMAPFVALHGDRGLREVTQACIGEGFTAPGSLVMCAVAGGKGQSWHQDCPPGDSQRYNLNRLFYTRDVTFDDGAVVVVPGSHRMGRIPPGGNQEPIDGEVTLTPRAGTLVLLHGHVYHRVTPNFTGKPRISVNFRAFNKNATPDVTRLGVYRNGTFDFGANKVVDEAVGQ